MYEIPWFLSGERKTFEGIASPELGILWKYFSNIRYFYIFYRNVFLLQNFEAMFLWNEKAIQIVAGPCSVESEEQLFATARGLKKIGIQTLRGRDLETPFKGSSFRRGGRIRLAVVTTGTAGIKYAGGYPGITSFLRINASGPVFCP